jgi:sulfite oxidase
MVPRRDGTAQDRLIVWSAVPLNAETPASVLCRSPGTPVDAFFVRDHGPAPAIDPDDYRLTLGGRVRVPLSLSLAELRDRFEPVTVPATLACAGNRRSELGPIPGTVPWGPGAIGTATWTGARLRDVLRAAGIAPGARHVVLTGADEIQGERFGGSVPLGKAVHPDVLLAYAMNGEPLTRAHGFPVRAIVPGYIGARSVKWLAAISVQRVPSRSVFQRDDYAIDGVPLGELPLTSAICRPADGDLVPSGTVRVEGYAMGAGGWPVGGVDVSCNGGRSWRSAVLGAAPGPWAWRLWHADVRVPPGPCELVVRASDTSGARQPARPATAGNPRGYLNNAWHRIRVVALPQPAVTERREAVPR